MLTINLDPVAFYLGDLPILWTALTMGVGIIVFLFLSLSEAKRVRLPIKHYYGMAFLSVASGTVFSRLLYVVTNVEYYSAHPEQMIGFENWGTAGIIVGGILAILLYSLVTKASFWQLTDVFALGLVAGTGIATIGYIFGGYFYGVETSIPWAIAYSNPAAAAPLNVPLHPTQIYYLLWSIVVVVILYALRHRLPVYGSLALLAISLCTLGEFLIFYFRSGDPILFGLQSAQLLSLGVWIAASTGFIARIKRVY